MSQAKFYFFQFGKDAENLSPEELRKMFENIYQQTASTYQEQGGILTDKPSTKENAN